MELDNESTEPQFMNSLNQPLPKELLNPTKEAKPRISVKQQGQASLKELPNPQQQQQQQEKVLPKTKQEKEQPAQKQDQPQESKIKETKDAGQQQKVEKKDITSTSKTQQEKLNTKKNEDDIIPKDNNQVKKLKESHRDDIVNDLKQGKKEKQNEGQQVIKSEEVLREEYFKSLKLKLQDGESYQMESIETCNCAVESVQKDILNQKLSISGECKDADVLAAQITLKLSETFEINIKETKLKERQKLKRQLEEKLLFIDQDISLIENEIDPKELHNKNHKGKKMSEEEKHIMLEQFKAVARERKQLEQRRAKRIEEIAEKNKLLDEEREAQEKEERIKKESEKAEELRKKLAEQKEYSANRDEQFKAEREKLKKILDSKPLFEKLLEKSKESENITLEEKKQTLAEIRRLHQPLRIQDIKEHANKVKLQLEAISEQHQAEELRKIFKYERPFVSEVYKKVSKEKKRLINDSLEEVKKHHDFQEKVKAFQENILKKVEVKVDQQKVSQIKAAIEEQQHKPHFSWFKEKKKRPRLDLFGGNNSSLTLNNEENAKEVENHGSSFLTPKGNSRYILQGNTQLSRKLGKEYLQILSQANRTKDSKGDKVLEVTSDSVGQKKGKELAKNASDEGLLFSSKNSSFLPGIRTNNSTHSSQKKIDYLSEIRAQHSLRSHSTPDWQRFLQNSSKMTMAQKGQYILLESQKLERQAERKEVLQRNGVKSDHKEEEGSEMVNIFIESIKAKLSFIKQVEEEQS